MKKTIALFLMALITKGALAEPKELKILYSADFIDFYYQFRSAVASNDDSILKLVCFPFESTETSETIETTTINISLAQFKRRHLQSYFLENIAGLMSTSIEDGLPTKRLYTSAKDFIIKNPDPSSPKELNENSRNLFIATPSSVVMSNLFFSKRNNKWCWSGAETNEPISKKLRQK